MGAILAKFRKEKSTQEVLEALQEKIDTLENFTFDTQQQKKRVVGNFVAVSIGVYILAFLIFYFVYFPPTWRERFIYSTPLLIFPVIIVLLRHLFTWYFQRKLNRNSKKLAVLRGEKKKILEQVMDKETYKVAVNLLARFADKPSSSNRTYSAMTSTTRTSSRPNQTLLSQSTFTPQASSANLKLPITGVTSTPITTSSASSQPLGIAAAVTPRSVGIAASPSPMVGGNQLIRRRTPYPIINQQKGVFEKIVDLLVGDGPADRFALICKSCYAHNGMVHKENFEYIAFRCAYCNVLNPAMKARPAAPRLSNIAALKPADSSSEENEDSDAESPVISRPPNQFDSTPRSTSLSARPSVHTRISHRSSSSSTTDEDETPATTNLTSGDTLSTAAQPRRMDADSAATKLSDDNEKSDSAIDTTTSPVEQ